MLVIVFNRVQGHLSSCSKIKRCSVQQPSLHWNFDVLKMQFHVSRDTTINLILNPLECVYWDVCVVLIFSLCPHTQMRAAKYSTSAGGLTFNFVCCLCASFRYLQHLAIPLLSQVDLFAQHEECLTLGFMDFWF